jgi:mannose-6-phosphate isomerase-like protein (cupin superfamily)
MPSFLSSYCPFRIGMGSIEQIKTLIDSDGKRVVEILLPPDADVPWHLHSAIVKYCYCLSGQLTFERKGSEPIILYPGEYCEVPCGVPHRVLNRNRSDCRFLIVQNGDYYDFLHRQNETE